MGWNSGHGEKTRGNPECVRGKPESAGLGPCDVAARDSGMGCELCRESAMMYFFFFFSFPSNLKKRIFF